MFSDDEIAEVMADEIGEVRVGQSRTLLVRLDDVEDPLIATRVFHRVQYAVEKQSWPESETYPSARWNTLLGPTKAARYGQAL